MPSAVARDAELKAIGRFLSDLREGPAAVVLEGPAGIGKTTLWEAAVHSAAERGYRVLKARPSEAEARLSYAGLADLVDAVFDSVRAELPRPQERALAAALLRADDDSADARTVATAFVSVVGCLVGEGPVVVAVDDVQWLDPASRRVLEFAVRRLAGTTGLLVAHRTDDRGDPPLGLARALPQERLERLTVRPLSLAALHHVVRARVGFSPPRPLLARLVSVSGGNPYFALEIARLLAEEPANRRLADPLPVPLTLREVVAARVDSLSESARAVALVAATLAQPTPALIAEALGPEVHTDDALVEAEEAGVIAFERGRIRFAHPVIASAVYGSAPGERRRRLHERLVELVSDAEERAWHMAQSTIEADSAAAHTIELGARGAARRGAQDAAAELFEAAHRATPPDRHDDLARRLLGAAAALNAVGDFAEARALAERALAKADARRLRTDALVFLGSLAWYAGAAADATSHVERALDEADDPASRGRIFARFVRFNFAHDLARATRYADAALGLLDDVRQPALVAHVLIDRFFAGALQGHGAQDELLHRGLALEQRALPELPDGPQPMPLIWFHCVDDFDGVRARYAFENEWYGERGEELWQADRLSHLAVAELRAGRWHEARQSIDASCAVLDTVDIAGPRALVLEKRSLIDGHCGNIDRARATLLPLIERFERAGQPWWAALTLSTLAFVEFAAGDHGAVDRALARMHAFAEAVGARDVLFDRSEPFHVESLLALGELERAREAFRRLEHRGRTLPRAWISAALPRTRALVNAADGHPVEALTALDEPALVTAAQLPFELGCTLLVKGQLLRRAKQKRAAADALSEAQRDFEQVGALPWVERARGELDRVGLQRRPPDELTATERRVAELVAAGMSNRQVAEVAFMSRKTVEANLTRVYRKLGIHSRAELGGRIAVAARDEAAEK